MNRRTLETQKRYDDDRKKGETIITTDESGNRYLDWTQEQPIREYEHWVIIPNRYPYDAIFVQHDLLIPKRHFSFIREATNEERHEYYRIKKELDGEGVYESIIENFSNSRSVQKHFHAHLVDWIE